MGEKGSKLTGDAAATAEWLVEVLAPLGDVTSKRMFGGYGIFSDGVMFALVDSAGVGHFRTDVEAATRYAAAGASKHARMPYWSIPKPVAGDGDRLVEWGGRALETAKAAKA